MNRLSRTVLSATAAVALAAGHAAAQTITSPIRYIEQPQGLTPFVGWVFTNPTLLLSDTVSVRLGPQSAPIFGLAYAYRASGPLSLQASVGYMPAKREVFLAEANADSTVIRPIDTGRRANAGILLAEAGFLFHVTGPRAYRGFAPFFGLKAGYAGQVTGGDPLDVAVPDSEQYRFGPTFALGGNLGTDVFIGRAVSVRAELDPRLWHLTAPPGFRANGQAKISRWKDASSAQIGLTLHF